MGPFEQINIPQVEDTDLTCWSDLVDSINEYFDQEWNYLNKEDIGWILNNLNTDIDSCQSNTTLELLALNENIYTKWIHIQSWSIWENRFLPEVWINKDALAAFLWEIPDSYTLRVSWETVVISNNEWTPLAEFSTETWEYSTPWWLTRKDNTSDNINWSEYVLTEAILQRKNVDEANSALDDLLEEETIFIDNLQDPETLELTAKMYEVNVEWFQWAISDFIARSEVPVDNNFQIKKLTSWGFQISMSGSGIKFLANYDWNWDYMSDVRFRFN